MRRDLGRTTAIAVITASTLRAVLPWAVSNLLKIGLTDKVDESNRWRHRIAATFGKRGKQCGRISLFAIGKNCQSAGERPTDTYLRTGWCKHPRCYIPGGTQSGSVQKAARTVLFCRRITCGRRERSYVPAR